MRQKSNTDLFSLVSIPEAANMYQVSKQTIKYHMNRGNLQFRKTGGERRGQYLITLASLQSYYQKPPMRMPEIAMY